MVEYSIYETLDKLAGRYIPEGRHKLLYVDSREAWLELMLGLIENKSITPKYSTMLKFAENWEQLITKRISMLN